MNNWSGSGKPSLTSQTSPGRFVVVSASREAPRSACESVTMTFIALSRESKPNVAHGISDALSSSEMLLHRLVIGS